MIVVEASLDFVSYPNFAAVAAIDLQANRLTGGRFLADHFRNLEVANQPAELLVRGPPIAGFNRRTPSRAPGWT